LPATSLTPINIAAANEPAIEPSPPTETMIST
jgi:hypothetical protein